MEIVALVVGTLVGIFIGIILHGRRLQKGYAGTLVLDCSDPLYPDIYLQLNQDAALLADFNSVSMDVKVVKSHSQK